VSRLDPAKRRLPSTTSSIPPTRSTTRGRGHEPGHAGRVQGRQRLPPPRL
jgi:hypothetical protein